MPDIENDDLDNLFRRAAEGYPLRTDSSDWDKVARELDEDETDPSFIIPPVYTGEEKKKRRRVLLMLLLLPLLGIGYYLWNTGSSSSIKHIAEKSTSTNENKIVPKNKSTDKSLIDKKQENNIAEKDAVNKSADINNSVSEKRLTSENEKNSSKVNAVNSEKFERLTNNSTANHSIDHNKKATPVFEKIFEKNYSSTTENNNRSIAGNNIDKDGNTELQRVSGFAINPVSDKNISSPDIINKNLKTSVASFIKTDSSSVNNKKDKGKNKKPSYFYAGLSVAPDVSTVKFQSVKGTGYTAGILLGYNITRKIAIETGAYYDYKKYYTQGKYFHTAFPGYGDLLNVNGGCRMIEVPLNLKYSFVDRDNTQWFATTGLSSYYMFKEGYTYNYLYNGMPQQKYYTYKNGSQNWFSVLNFSIGYGHNIGTIGNLRLEPYLRVPLTGMGTGNLPIMSVGLNIGFTHPF